MSLSLKFGPEASVACEGRRLWRGCSAETLLVPAGEAYEFSHAGDLHYLALHDIVLADGEMSVDTLGVVRGRDIRDTLTFVPKGCELSGWARAEPRENRFTALYFDPSAMHEEIGARYRQRDLPPTIYGRDPSLQATVEKLRTVLILNDGDALLAETLCLTAALEVFAIVSSPTTGRLSERQMKIVRAFIDEFLDQPISLSDLAGAAGLSRYHFSRAFKATTGQAPYRFVATLRVDAAARMLASSQVAIDMIATSVGFTSTAQFRRAFQIRMGMTPQMYRRQAT